MKRRRVIQLVLLLIAGAIVNVAVAWTLPNYTRLTWSDDGPPNVDDIEWWRANAPAGREVSDAPARVIRQKGFGFRTVYMIELTRTERSQPTGHTFERKMLGWPMLSLQLSLWDDPTQRDILRGVILFSNLLPIGPVWPGFAINTIFYAAILWVVFAVPLALRRRRRIKRGLCPACASDLRGRGASQNCPECGTPITPRAGSPPARPSSAAAAAHGHR